MALTQGLLKMAILKLQEHFPLRICDWLVAGFLTTWGLACLAAQPDVWALPVNRELANIGPQGLWGAAAVALGLVRLAALFINGAVRRTPHVRAGFAFLTMFIWLQLTLGVFSASVPSLSVIVYPWLLLADTFNVFRAAQDAKFSDLKFMALRGAPKDAPST